MIALTEEGGKAVLLDPNETLKYVRHRIADDREWFSEISARPGEYLSVVKYKGGKFVIIFVTKEPYKALDASRSEAFSARRAFLSSEGTQTVVPENIVLDMIDARNVLESYIDSGELDPRYFWLPDDADWPRI